MEEVFGARFSSLHVRVGNRGALHLYRESLGYQVQEREAKYYADGEDAYDMRKPFAGYHDPKARKSSTPTSQPGEGPSKSSGSPAAEGHKAATSEAHPPAASTDKAGAVAAAAVEGDATDQDGGGATPPSTRKAAHAKRGHGRR